MRTGISYKSSENEKLFGRTQEYHIEFDYYAVQFPRNYKITRAADTWTTLYSVLGMEASFFRHTWRFSSPSRFTKAVTLTNFAEEVPSNSAPNLCFHILSMSEIPKGAIDCGGPFEYTQYTSIYNQTKKELYDNIAIQKVKFDNSLAQSVSSLTYKLEKSQSYQSIN